MRLRATLAVVALALSHVSSRSISQRHPGQPEPLPPEDDYSIRALSANNITVPSPPSTTPTSPPSPVPTPLDLSISYALSDSCLLYLSSVLSSSTFTSCLPFSLLLTTSTSYASLLSKSLASGNLTTLNNLVSYVSSPQPSSDQCDDYFTGVLSALNSKGNCAYDLSQGTSSSIAREAQAGMGNYALMRKAAGITDPDTGKYCYLQAVASTTPDDLYLWSIPSGVGSSKPTCSKCSSLLLNHYAENVGSVSTLNSTLLQSSINTVNAQCGPTFATYSAASKGAAGRAATLGWIKIIGSFLGISAFVGLAL